MALRMAAVVAVVGMMERADCRNGSRCNDTVFKIKQASKKKKDVINRSRGAAADRSTALLLAGKWWVQVGRLAWVCVCVCGVRSAARRVKV